MGYVGAKEGGDEDMTTGRVQYLVQDRSLVFVAHLTGIFRPETKMEAFCGYGAAHREDLSKMHTMIHRNVRMTTSIHISCYVDVREFWI